MLALPLVPCSLAISFLWGLTPPTYKYLMSADKVDPIAVFVISGAAYAASLVCFSLCFHVPVAREVRRLSGRSVAIIAGLSVLTGFVANILYIYLLRNHASYAVTALAYSAPVFTLLLSVLVLKERVTALGVLGAVLILLGVACVSFSGGTTDV